MDFSKIFSPIAKAFSWAKKEVTATWTSLTGDGSQAHVNASNLMDNDKNWVYVCVDKIADSVSAIQLKLMKYNKSGDDTEVVDHPALKLVEQPNEQMTGRDFRYVTMSHLELTGNAYWLKDKPNNPTSLFPLNPRQITPKLAPDGMSIVSYKYRAGTVAGIVKEQDIDPSLIIHLKYPNPKNPLIGRGTLEPIAEWVDVDNYATEFNRRFFLNSATFGGAIETQANTKEALEQVRLSFENTHKGLQNAHKFLFLPKGSTLNDAAMSPRDMQMQNADSTFRDKILAAFGVPKSVVGIVEDVNRANAESSNYVFSVFTVKPKTDRLVTYLNEFYLEVFSGADQMYFTYDDPTPENATLEITENQASLGNAPWKSVNEVRAEKGLPPIEGGDVVNTLTTLIPISDVMTPDDEDQEIETEPAKTFKKRRSPRPDYVGNVVDSLSGKLFDLFNTKAQNDSFAVQHRDFISKVTIYEQQFDKIVRDYDQAQKQEVLKKVNSFTSEVSDSDIFDREKEIEKLIALVTPLIKKLSKEQGERATEQVNKTQLNNFLKKDYSVTDRLETIITNSIKRMAKSYTATTLDLLTTKINAGIQAGDSIAQITAAISDVYALSEGYRAERMARTEVFSAANDASKDAYIASGVVKSLRWKTAEDELTCPFCAPLDNKIISVTDNFYDKGTTLTGTQDGKEVSMSLDYEGIENPPLHPNCRCFIIPEEISTKEMPKKVEKTKKPDHTQFFANLDKILNDETANVQ